MTERSIGIGDIRIDIADALRSTYIGIPTDSEASSLIRRTFYLPRNMETLINNIVQDPRTEYTAFDDFCRHAVIGLLDGFYEYGYPDVELGAELNYVKSLRTQSHRASRRAELRELSHMFDEELDIARLRGDWPYILEHLELREKQISDAPSDMFRHDLMAEASKSSALRNCIAALARWMEVGETSA